MPQRYGSASSYGKKYALGNLFLIDDTQDSDATNNHGKSTKDVKPSLSVNTQAFTKATEYLKSGGDITAITKKMRLFFLVHAYLEEGLLEFALQKSQ